ncbi:hypothetical protein L1O03_11100 [Corynebacterium uropygiale]|uniref:Secreted protein n=1 Tax=Corynebacterium uropygiale TaxID=1775911 RepID=A0A9X1QVE2_9CORY|nr:hypothetical protein [Corynebacterium uropygiale]MCF4007710.1 hypothetical protein [Corynebacterium uropygiale]
MTWNLMKKSIAAPALGVMLVIGGTGVACAQGTDAAHLGASQAQAADEVPTIQLQQINDSAFVLDLPDGVGIDAEAGTLTIDGKDIQLPDQATDREGNEATLYYTTTDKGVELRAIERYATREFRQCDVPEAENPLTASVPVQEESIEPGIQNAVQDGLVAAFPTCFH